MPPPALPTTSLTAGVDAAFLETFVVAAFATGCFGFTFVVVALAVDFADAFGFDAASDGPPPKRVFKKPMIPAGAEAFSSSLLSSPPPPSRPASGASLLEPQAVALDIRTNYGK